MIRLAICAALAGSLAGSPAVAQQAQCGPRDVVTEALPPKGDPA